MLKSSAIGSPATTAQVHPRLLTRAMWAAAEAAGAKLVRATVAGITVDSSGGHPTVTGVELEGGAAPSLEADAVVIALGPWSGQARAWLPSLPAVGGQKVHSAVLRPRGGGGGGGAAAAIGATMVFAAYRDARGRASEPEVYPRPDGSVYVCGESSGAPLPRDPAAVAPDSEAAIERVLEAAGALSSALRCGGGGGGDGGGEGGEGGGGATVEARQACYLPITGDGLPFIGRVPGVQGAYIAAGHSCWGILNGPASGLALAELMVQGVSSIDLSAFDSARIEEHWHEYGAV